MQPGSRIAYGDRIVERPERIYAYFESEFLHFPAYAVCETAAQHHYPVVKRQSQAAFARIETSGKYVHEDEAAQHKVNVPVGKFYYRVWTNSDDMETLFLTIFAISETEQTVVE